MQDWYLLLFRSIFPPLLCLGTHTCTDWYFSMSNKVFILDVIFFSQCYFALFSENLGYIRMFLFIIFIPMQQVAEYYDVFQRSIHLPIHPSLLQCPFNVLGLDLCTNVDVSGIGSLLTTDLG